jgi:hypothetical protein
MHSSRQTDRVKGEEIEEPVCELSEDEIALLVQFFKTLDEWDREYKDSQFAARESQTGFQREAV